MNLHLFYNNIVNLPGSIIKSRPVGVLLTQDQDSTDSKIIAVPATKVDPGFSNIDDINNIPSYIRNKLQHFVEHHKDLVRQICKDIRMEMQRISKEASLRQLKDTIVKNE